MRRSIATVSLPGSLRQKLEAAAAAGFEGIELFEPDLTASDLSPRDVRDLCRSLGLEVVALQPLRDFEAQPARLAVPTMRRAEAKLALAEELGARRLLICSSVSPDAVADDALAAAQLRDLAERAARRGIRIGYEALSWGRHVRDYRHAWRIVSLADHPNLGIVLDSFHVNALGLELDSLLTIPAERIALVQIADAPLLDMGVLYLSRHYRCFPGQGNQPVVEFMQRVHGTGYDDWVSHEIFSDDFRGARAKPTALDGRRSLVWLDSVVGRNDSVAEAAAHTDATMLRNIAFVEFAAEPGSDRELLDLLANLGFVQTHRHRTKDVRLYQLGGVNLILNYAPGSYAESFFWEHGVAVCAIGVAVRDTERLRERARALEYEWIDSISTGGELQVPAVRGPGGVLVHFVAEGAGRAPFHAVDFERIADAPPDPGWLSIDHVGQALRPEEFLPATLFLRAMLDLDVSGTTDLVDPGGLVYSRVARNRTGTVRLPINTTNSWAAGTRRFVELARGAGVQQVAISTADIFAAARRVDARHVLRMPGNYYRDLAARFELPAKMLAEMEERGVLYDADRDGALLHLYCTAVNGMFVEIVQRVGQYDRYGEANAPIRLAAQAREREREHAEVT